MMLRPTESVILWLQQLGRGLRRLEDKTLRVIDYIGNHRIFLTKVRALLDAGPGDRSLAMKLDEVVSGQFSLPAGCSVTYELEAIKMLRDLLRPKSGTEDLEAQYRDFKMREALRPTASEIGRMGFDPARTGHGTWFEFVRDMGDPVEPDVLTTHSSLLRQIERERTLGVEDLTAVLAAASGATITGPGTRVWAVSSLFRSDGAGIVMARKDATGALLSMVQELVDWRLSMLSQGRRELDAPQGIAPTPPVLWREYLREDIAQLFGTKFNPGNWNAGIVRLDKDMILLTTLNKTSMATGGHYDDGFLSPDHLRWQSQTQTRQDSLIGRILSGREPGTRVHLFIRNGKLRNGKAAPFLYCGRPMFEDWQGERPITVTWVLPQPVPEHLRKSLVVPEGPDRAK